MVGQTISHYRIEEKLGEGGMGVVYKARDTRLDRFVAIKLLPADKVADPERKRRFVQEAKAASALNHPNIITVHDIDQADGVDFIATWPAFSLRTSYNLRSTVAGRSRLENQV